MVEREDVLDDWLEEIRQKRAWCEENGRRQREKAERSVPPTSTLTITKKKEEEENDGV